MKDSELPSPLASVEWLAFAMAAGALAFSPTGGGGNEPWAAALRQGLLTVSLGCGLLCARASSSRGGSWLGMKIPIALFIGTCLLSWLTSGYELSSRLEIVDVLLFTGLFSLLLMRRGEREIGVLLNAAVLVASVYAIHAIYQKVALGQSRCASTFFNPNFAASFFLGSFGLGLGLLRAPNEPRWRRWLCLMALGVLLAGIWFTESRSALGGVVVLGAAFLWATARKARWVIPGTAIVIAALILIPNPARDRLAKGVSKDPYAFDRLKIWEQTLRMIKDHPITGVGIGNFEYSTQRYRFPIDREMGRYGRVYRDAHNSYLQVAAEIGLPGAAFLLAFFLVLFRRIWLLLGDSPWKGHKDIISQGPEGGAARCHVIGAFLALVAILSQAFFHETVDSPPSVFLAVLAAGVVGFYWRHLGGETHKSQASDQTPTAGGLRISKTVRVLTAIFLILILWPHFSLRIFVGDLVFRKAEEALDQGGAEAAEQLVRDAIRINPSQAYFHKTLGDLLIKRFEETGELGLLREAEQELETAASLNRLDPQLVFQLGQFYRYVSLRGIGGVEVAGASLAAYRKAVEMSPFNVHYLARLSLEEMRRGNLEEALKASKNAVELEPEFLTGLYLVASLHWVRGEVNLAERWLDRMGLAQQRHANHAPINAYERLLGLLPEQYFPEERPPSLPKF